jgi:hypothetical protein
MIVGLGPGLPDFSRYNLPKREKYTKWPQNVTDGHKIYHLAAEWPYKYQHLALQVLSKWTLIGNFKFENTPSGNTARHHHRKLRHCAKLGTKAQVRHRCFQSEFAFHLSVGRKCRDRWGRQSCGRWGARAGQRPQPCRPSRMKLGTVVLRSSVGCGCLVIGLFTRNTVFRSQSYNFWIYNYNARVVEG